MWLHPVGRFWFSYTFWPWVAGICKTGSGKFHLPLWKLQNGSYFKEPLKLRLAAISLHSLWSTCWEMGFFLSFLPFLQFTLTTPSPQGCFPGPQEKSVYTCMFWPTLYVSNDLHSSSLSKMCKNIMMIVIIYRIYMSHTWCSEHLTNFRSVNLTAVI